jgi:pimeloyl-ACP methyl ester carboxylesterase
MTIPSTAPHHGSRPADEAPGAIDIRNFRVEIDHAVLADLRERLARSRFPDAETVSDWAQGVPLAYLREVAEYWAHYYDPGRVAGALNGWPQYLASIDRLDIHFLHVRSKHVDARPLIMSHGWPGSVLEFADVIAPLTDPTAHGGAAEDAFHLVVPALPGYGFSGKPSRPGFDLNWIAGAWDRLMARLGYRDCYAHGGDWGAIVCAAMGQRRPRGLRGIHVNAAVVAPAALAELGELTSDEQHMLAEWEQFTTDGSGYAQQQATRPQTLGYALADSPTGQLAWILEKIHAWTDCAGHPENAVPRDKILDTVTLYWLTNAASSARLYWESYHNIFTGGDITVPSAYSQFARENLQVIPEGAGPVKVADRCFLGFFVVVWAC